MKTHSNRRQYQRIKADSSHILLGTPFTPLDLSETGMQLSCREKRQTGENIPLTLQLRNARLSLYARVVWCHRAASIFENGYRMGLRFSDCTVSQQLLVKKYVTEKADNGLVLDVGRAASL